MKYFLWIVIIVLIIGGIYFLSEKEDGDLMMDDGDEMMEEVNEMMDNGEMMNDDGEMGPAMEGEMMEGGEAMMDEMMEGPGSYEAYAPEKIAKANENNDVVLFFRASWCPTCRTLDKNIKADLSSIPSSLTILDVDYDNSTELKKKYGVTYQHTLVQVDAGGNMIKKWSGGSNIADIVSKIN